MAALAMTRAQRNGLRAHQAPRDNPLPPRYKSHPAMQGLASNDGNRYADIAPLVAGTD